MSDKLKEEGRAILAEKRKKVARDTLAINDMLPNRGLWVANVKTRRVAGIIDIVRRNGAIVILDAIGIRVDQTSDKLRNNGYAFYRSKPSGKSWEFLPLRKGENHANAILKSFYGDDEDQPKKRMPKTIVLSKCVCGCGETVKRMFKPGHDSTFKKWLTNELFPSPAGSDKKVKITKAQYKYLSNAKWFDQKQLKRLKTS